MPADYSGQNLRGRNFKGKNLRGANFKSAILRGANFKAQDLTDADFSYANIYSADFTGANLTKANFSHAKAGLQRRWAILLVLISWALIGLSGFFSAAAGTLVAMLVFSTDKNYHLMYQIAGSSIILITAIFFLFTIRQGISAGLGAFIGSGALAGALAGALVGALALVFQNGNFSQNFVQALAFTLAGALALVLALAEALGGAGVLAVTRGGALAVTGAVIEAVIGALAGFFLGDTVGHGHMVKAELYALPGAVALATGAIVLLSIYISRRAFKGDPKHVLIRNIAVAFAAFKGTSFRRANLTDADFTATTLKSTDFRLANLTRTCWRDALKLDRVRPGTTYLQNTLLRQVLVTGRGEKQIFDQQNLRGVNLLAANLQDASFIATDLSEANLQDADLSRTKLVQTQLDQTDLTGATLTGAYIEEWNISTRHLQNSNILW